MLRLTILIDSRLVWIDAKKIEKFPTSAELKLEEAIKELCAKHLESFGDKLDDMKNVTPSQKLIT